MQDAPVGSQDAPVAGYSLQQAAALLGIGVNTLRRRIAAGQVRAEQVQRPQGFVWRVYLDGRHLPSHAPVDPPMQEATGSLPHSPAPVGQAEALASLIQTTIGTVLGPLVAEMAAQRQTNERQGTQLVAQAETIGRLTAELDRAAGTVVALGDELERLKRPEPPTAARTEPAAGAPSTDAPFASTRRWWLRWALALLGALVLAGVFLLFPR